MDEKQHEPAISRRNFALGAAASACVVAAGGAKWLPRQHLLRPPGGQDEDWLLAGCIHCEKCREVCPQHAIRSAHLETGLLNARTPRMDFKRGWCDFCAEVEGGPRCAAVCPTDALQPTDSTVEQVIIGRAELNRDWCLAARGMGCHECLDACEYDAMEMGYDNVPVVLTDMCNGCGACELACISMSSGTLTVGATDRAIVVVHEDYLKEASDEEVR